MKNTRGWIRIIEAVIALLLITSVVLIVIGKGYIGGEDISEGVIKMEQSILKEIQGNEELRAEIISIEDDDLPVKWEDFESRGLVGVREKIIERVPNYLTCEAKVCPFDRICDIEKEINSNIYSQSIGITASLEYYRPRQLKMFCWVFN